MSKAAVFFPGIGYTLDKPLMHYSRKLAAGLGYEIILVPYGGFPPKIQGDAARMLESFQMAYAQAEKLLSEVDFSSYEEVVFVSKSIGTAVAAKIATQQEEGEKIRHIFYTPLPETFAYPIGDAVAFTGTNDPWVGGENSRIPTLCWQKNIPCHLVEGGNHSLESDDVIRDIKHLKKVMKETRRFLLGMKKE